MSAVVSDGRQRSPVRRAGFSVSLSSVKQAYYNFYVL